MGQLKCVILEIYRNDKNFNLIVRMFDLMYNLCKHVLVDESSIGIEILCKILRCKKFVLSENNLTVTYIRSLFFVK